jgi:hypothetical protein
LDPEGTADIPQSAFDESTTKAADELVILQQDVEEIYMEAGECEDYGQDENAWCIGVVQPLMQRGLKSSSILQLKSVYVRSFYPLARG